jgi:hypothetical protein
MHFYSLTYCKDVSSTYLFHRVASFFSSFYCDQDRLGGMMESTRKTQSIHALKKNLKYMVGDFMELEIVKQLCNTP